VTHAKDWTYAKIPPGNTPEKLEHKIIVAGDGYLNIWLTSFRICNVRKGLKKFFGTVYSYISLPIIENGKAEFQSVTTPRELQKIDAQHLDRIIISNQRLLGPIPYRGGDLSLEIGLCSIKEADLAGPFLDLLGSISKIAGVSFISASLPFVSILKDGFNLLSGADSDSILEIGLKTATDKPETGYFVVIRATRDQIDPETLKIVDNQLVDKDGKSIADYPYLVIRVEVSKKYNEWFLIPDLDAAHKAVNHEILSGTPDKINEALTVFHRTALACPELVTADAKSIIVSEDEYVNSFRTKATAKGVAQPAIRELKDVKIK
jgi:hypothetical protein